MEWLIFLVFAAVVWFWVQGKSRSTRSNATRASELSEIRVRVSTTSTTGRVGRGEADRTDVGELTAAGPEAWVLNPKAPIPITVCGATKEVAARLKGILGDAQYWSQKVPEVALLIAQHNLRFKEVDDFIAEHRPKFETEMARLVADSAEWAAASERDRQDLRAEFELKALGSLAVSVGRADLALLLRGEPPAFKEDDELLRRFAGDGALYSLYLSLLSRSSHVVTVKADDYMRKSWEKLVELSFARRGKDIPTRLLLEGLRLKDINEILAGAVEKPSGRKAKAIEAALALPDLQSRLSERISYRETFQVVPPSDIDTAELATSLAYANALATVVQQTFYTGVRTLEAIIERNRETGFYNAWEIKSWEDPVPPCAAAVCKKYDRLPAKRPPFHVGCNCQLEPSFKD